MRNPPSGSAWNQIISRRDEASSAVRLKPHGNRFHALPLGGLPHSNASPLTAPCGGAAGQAVYRDHPANDQTGHDQRNRDWKPCGDAGVIGFQPNRC